MENLINLDKNPVTPAIKTMENKILHEVLTMSKSLIKTFEYSMIYSSKVSKKQEEKTEKLVKAYRKKHWADAMKKAREDRDKAYNIYISNIKDLF